jgi:hypothetical protein
VQEESPDAELMRLFWEQFAARENEAFGGFSAAERIEFQQRENRIRELQAQILKRKKPQS